MYVFSFTLHLLEIFIFQIVPKYDSIPFRTSYKFLTDSTSPGGGGGVTPYIRMIGMIVVFFGVVIGDLVFFRGCSSKIL